MFIRMLSLTVLLLTVCATTVPACEFAEKSTEVYKELGLSDEQVAKLESLRNEMKKVRAVSAGTSENVRKKIDAELLKDKPDPKAIDKLVDKQAEIRSNISKARVDALTKAKGIVSKKQFAALVAKHWGCRCAEPVNVLGE